MVVKTFAVCHHPVNLITKGPVKVSNLYIYSTILKCQMSNVLYDVRQ